MQNVPHHGSRAFGSPSASAATHTIDHALLCNCRSACLCDSFKAVSNTGTFKLYYLTGQTETESKRAESPVTMHVEFRDRLQACTVSRHFYRYTKVQNLMYLYLGLRLGLEIWSRLATLGPIEPMIANHRIVCCSVVITRELFESRSFRKELQHTLGSGKARFEPQNSCEKSLLAPHTVRLAITQWN